MPSPDPSPAGLQDRVQGGGMQGYLDHHSLAGSSGTIQQNTLRLFQRARLTAQTLHLHGMRIAIQVCQD